MALYCIYTIYVYVRMMWGWSEAVQHSAAMLLCSVGPRHELSRKKLRFCGCIASSPLPATSQHRHTLTALAQVHINWFFTLLPDPTGSALLYKTQKNEIQELSSQVGHRVHSHLWKKLFVFKVDTVNLFNICEIDFLVRL